MKATLIVEKVSTGLNEFIHGGGRKIRRLVVKEVYGVTVNLLINAFEGDIVAFAGYQIDPNDCQVLGEVDISEELVKIASDYAVAKHNLEARRIEFEEILNQEMK